MPERKPGGEGSPTPPQPLGAHHDLSAFPTGSHATLDDWLRERARSSEGLSARSYVICDAAAPARVIGYYAISTAMEQRSALPSAKLRRGMPDQVPLLLIGRLAVDADWQGRGLGSALLHDALRRCLAAAGIAGARAVIARAIDDAAAEFYERNGFLRSTIGARVMLMPMETVRRLLGE